MFEAYVGFWGSCFGSSGMGMDLFVRVCERFRVVFLDIWGLMGCLSVVFAGICIFRTCHFGFWYGC